MLSITHSDDEISNSFQYSDEEYEYQSDDDCVVDDTKIDDEDNQVTHVNPLLNNYFDRLGIGNTPNKHVDTNSVQVTQSSTNVKDYESKHSKTRVISDWFSNMSSTIGVQKTPTPTFKPRKKLSSYIFQSNEDMMKSNLTVDGLTHFEQTNFDIQMKLNSVDFVKFSLGSGVVLSLSTHYAKWIINDYEPHMWREVGIHIYTMFGNDWNNISLFKAKAVIDQCLALWREIKKEIYIIFCEIVLEKEYTDENPVPDNIKTQINRAMWNGSVKKPYRAGFLVFQSWYESKLIKLFAENKKLKEMKKENNDIIYHHMLNFCGLYTMHNRVDGAVNLMP